MTDVLNPRQIDVRPAFEQVPSFLLGRGALTLSSQAGRERLMTGAAGGLEEPGVRLRALAELIEHTVAFVAGRSYRGPRGTYRELSARARVMNPLELTHFDSTVSARFDPVDQDTVLSFCEGRSLVDGKPILVPALMCFASFQASEPEPLFIKPGGTGFAAHTGEAAAAWHALLEVLERDACMLSWRVPSWPCRRLESSRLGAELQRVCASLGLEVELYDVGEPGLIPVVVALLARPDGSQLTLGSAAGWDARRTAEKAVGESLMLQWTLSRRRAEAACGEPPTSSLGHVLAAACRGPQVRDWYRRQARAGEPTRCTSTSSEAEPASLDALALDVREKLGGDVAAVNIGEALLHDSGWSVRRVLVSGAQPRESDARSAHLGGRRLRESNRKWNRSREPLQETPHPFG